MFCMGLNSTMSVVSKSNRLCSALHSIYAPRSLFSVVACCRGKSHPASSRVKPLPFYLFHIKDSTVSDAKYKPKTNGCQLSYGLGFISTAFGVHFIVLFNCGYYILRFQVQVYLRVRINLKAHEIYPSNTT